MPHAELSYSADLTIDAGAILSEIEAIISSHDDTAGDTKGRAYPADIYHHTHFKATIALLAKPHRNAAFLAALNADLSAAVAKHLPRPCWMSIDLVFSGAGYNTELLT
ncbi:MAG: hypothetical protein ABJL99_04695 [Aliishimia sp.]